MPAILSLGGEDLCRLPLEMRKTRPRMRTSGLVQRPLLLCSNVLRFSHIAEAIRRRFDQTLCLQSAASSASIAVLVLQVHCRYRPKVFMTTILLVIGSWLLLNILFVLIVIPPRQTKLTSSLGRAIDALRHFVRRSRRPPS
ncbi:hypothetical protein [Bradyrhizobium sp. DOA9]|uniref:hypothetical protein n=1 Tax=Bradyrhizobium sp. DOA9 TaxID=1126627 RepID=UPI0007235E3B|nr:hypothetical protein [Bradyrhizobium sp. DOA9]GAJ35351.1 hypothetical protein BDOA9_0145560 [Bradyrhizobium sp. DOA9]